MRALIIGLAIAALAFPAAASADCSDFKADVETAHQAFRDWKAYQRQDDLDMARASFDAFKHAIALGDDSKKGCPDPGLRGQFAYFSFQAEHRDTFFTQDGLKVQQLSGIEEQLDLWTMWTDGFGKSNASEYKTMVYLATADAQRLGIEFKSPENGAVLVQGISMESLLGMPTPTPAPTVVPYSR